MTHVSTADGGRGQVEQQDHPVAPAEVERPGFFNSMPRVLTALAGLVTAVGTAALYFHGGGGGTPQPQPPTQPVVVFQQPGATPPAAQDTASQLGTGRTTGVLSGQLASQQTPPGSTDWHQILTEWQATLNGQERATADACSSGSSAACSRTLQGLVAGCEQGYPLDCDTLYLVSPSGSNLEAYGNTCGGRVAGNSNTWCRDLPR